MKHEKWTSLKYIDKNVLNRDQANDLSPDISFSYTIP